MTSKSETAEAILARAKALEGEVAAALRNLDRDALARVAETALATGAADREALYNLFDRAVGQTLADSYIGLAEQSADDVDLPVPRATVTQEGASARFYLSRHMGNEAAEVILPKLEVAFSRGWDIDTLAREIREDIGLTRNQVRWVANFEQKLRTNPTQALDNALRDRRFDPTLRRGGALSEAQIQRMVERYRQRWEVYRSTQVAQVEMLRAANAATHATFYEADMRGQLPAAVRKFWWHAHDAHVRDSHRQIPLMNPEGVALTESFVTPLGNLRYPLDPLGSAENVNGCRCVLIIETSNPERRLR